MRLALGSLVLVASFTSPLAAQSINVDFGEPSAGPPSSYGAAGLPGYWNAIHGDGTDVTLKDLSGATTSVHFYQSGASAPYLENDPSLSGDDALLMKDGVITHTFGTDACFFFSGLQSGTYELITYAWRANHPSLVAKSFVDNTVGVEHTGGAWPGHHVHGVTYARHVVVVTSNGLLTSHSGLNTSAGGDTSAGEVCNGLQLRRITEYVPYCSGDGTATACPCGNSGTAGSGCASSVSASGAYLVATGIASVSADSLVLAGSDMPSSSVLYFQGTAQQSGGAGVVFGDGLRCVAGTIRRLGTKSNVSGASTYPAAGDVAISLRGAVPASGGTRYYQAWYRNVAGPCGSGYDLTNAIAVTWAP